MKVVFVCTGNTCRSPMACEYLASKRIVNLDVSSCGLCANGAPVNENSRIVMNEIGIDISQHISKRISASELSADRIICMSKNHFDALLSAGININKNVVSVLGNGIPDPFGSSIFVYRACRDIIINEINLLLDSGFFTDFCIKKADFNNITAMVELEKICFSEPWSKNAFSDSIRAGTKFYVAERNNTLLGYIGISAISSEGYITNIAVFPEYRKKGIATLLFDRVFRFAASNNLEFVSLEVRKSNATAISLYDKLGFKKEGIRKNFYREPNEDAVIMTRRF